MYAIEITVQGTAVTEVESRISDSGKNWCKFRVAANERIQNRATGEWSDGETTFLNVKCWGRLAENVAASITKGTPVVVQGRLNQRHYEREISGVTVQASSLDLSARVVGHDLVKGVAQFRRTKSPAVQRAEDRALADVGFSAQSKGHEELVVTAEAPPF